MNVSNELIIMSSLPLVAAIMMFSLPLVAAGVMASVGIRLAPMFPV